MDNYQRKGAALVLCAPSGSGKTTLSRRLLVKYPRLSFSVSCTTRPPRPGEVEGRDYFFIPPERFKERIERHYFAEWAKVHGHYYGTPMESASMAMEEGKDLLFDVDVQGAAQLKNTLPGAYFVFILPPSRQALEERLRRRASENDESIRLRLSNALCELKEAYWFDAWIINDDLDQAFITLCAVYECACISPPLRPNFLQQLIGEFQEFK
ncbi:MAG: guanylate kinase [Deltaproteobacteria bacterium]|jgi:guanylate kinase|nr:guanylate kinase [Deltaproteobacteria bacterium]